MLDVKLNARQRRRLRALKAAWIVLLLSLTMVATYLSYQGAAAVWDWAVADKAQAYCPREGLAPGVFARPFCPPTHELLNSLKA